MPEKSKGARICECGHAWARHGTGSGCWECDCIRNAVEAPGYGSNGVTNGLTPLVRSRIQEALDTAERNVTHFDTEIAKARREVGALTIKIADMEQERDENVAAAAANAKELLDA